MLCEADFKCAPLAVGVPASSGSFMVNLEVRVGPNRPSYLSPPNTQASTVKCVSAAVYSWRPFFYYKCFGASGRYVSVQRLDNNVELRLCEVQVMTQAAAAASVVEAAAVSHGQLQLDATTNWPYW